MAVDLNAVAQKLKEQRQLGVSKDGRLIEQDPNNDGSNSYNYSGTTLEPKRFFIY